MAAYRVGLIGLGEIGSLYELEVRRGCPSTHAEAFEAVPRVELVAGCDLSEERRRAFGRSAPGCAPTPLSTRCWPASASTSWPSLPPMGPMRTWWRAAPRAGSAG